YVGVTAFTVLVWDHIMTFSDEVEYVWKGRKGLAVYLFFLNRYLIPLSFIVNLWAYNRKCSHFVRYEGIMTMVGVVVVGFMMFLRVRALYPRSVAAQASVLGILLTFIGVNSWLLTHAVRTYTLLTCTMIVDPKIGPIASSTAWLPLLYDTLAIGLTLKGTAKYMGSRDSGQVFRVMLREGLLYYSVICTVSLVFTLMIIFAPPSVRNITGQYVLPSTPYLHLTVAMMSRITIHLKRFAYHPNSVIHSDSNRLPSTNQRHLLSPDQIETMPPPSFAAGSVPYSPNGTFLFGGTTTASGIHSYLGMQTFSTVAAVARDPFTQYSPEPPGASVGGNWVAPGTG
ncbi:hypothetical protein BJV74DRAFT_787513, partial [Russula compacta]